MRCEVMVLGGMDMWNDYIFGRVPAIAVDQFSLTICKTQQ